MTQRFWKTISNYGERPFMAPDEHRQNRILNHGLFYAIVLYLVTYIIALGYFYFMLRADFGRYWPYFWPYTAATIIPALATAALFFLRARPGYATFATVAAYLVAVMHNLALLFYLGFPGGFQFFLAALIPAAYLSHPHRRMVYLPLYLVTVVALVGGAFWVLTHQPLYPIPEPFRSITFYILIGTSSSFFIACFAYVAYKHSWVKRVMVYWEALSVYGLKWIDSDEERTHHIITNQAMVLNMVLPILLMAGTLFISVILAIFGEPYWLRVIYMYGTLGAIGFLALLLTFRSAANATVGARHNWLTLFVCIDFLLVSALIGLSGGDLGFQYYFAAIIPIPIFFFPGRRRLYIVEGLTLVFGALAIWGAPKIAPAQPLGVQFSAPVFWIITGAISLSVIAGGAYVWWQRQLTRRAFEYWEIVSYRSIPEGMQGDEKQWHALVNRIIFLTAIFWGPVYTGSQGFVLWQFWYHNETAAYILHGVSVAFPHSLLAFLGSLLVFKMKTNPKFYAWDISKREAFLTVIFSANSLLWLWGGFIYTFHVPLAIFNLAALQSFFLLKQNRWNLWQALAVFMMSISGLIGLWLHFQHAAWLPLPTYVTIWTLPAAVIYLVVLVVAITFYGRSEADKTKAALELAHEKSESLLLNILPRDVADELKDKGHSAPVRIESVTVMFTDFAGFTKISESLSPEQVVDELDKCFSYFDQIMEKYNLEKLKTIGDSYMCAGGIPKPNHTHAIDCCLAAMEIQSFMNQMKEIKAIQGLPYWELRLGIHTGPLVAGVVGHKKFAYDVWGDTVNTASRMESSGTTGKINISWATFEQAKFLFDCEHRGQVAAKNKGMIDMYYLKGIRPRFSAGGEGRGRVPNRRFKEIYAALGRGAQLVPKGAA